MHPATTPLYLAFDEPLGQPGVHRFGADFGQGPLDARFFQPSEAHERGVWRDAPCGDDPADAFVHRAALDWLDATLARELGDDGNDEGEDDGENGPRARYLRRVMRVAEDVVVVARGRGEGDLRFVHVRAPSGWRPERALGASLATLHAPVPGLLERAPASRLVQMMVERGPFVRFVWGVSTSGARDQHPDRVTRADWQDADRAFYRVERQVTVPLTRAEAALFLIRVYVHPVDALPPHVRGQLGEAIARTPPAMRAYKGFPSDEAILARFFGR